MAAKRELYLVLLAVSILVYVNSLGNAFISDDIPAIILNQRISRPLLSWRDPTQLTNSLGYLIAGFHPFVYHLTNVILHSCITLLVFSFLNLFFGLEAGFFAALLFAVHPAHTEAVTWISGRPYLFLTLFVLAAYLLYQRAAGSALKKGKRGFIFYGLSLACFSYFIIGNYPFFILFPFLLVLSDVTFGRWRENWMRWLPFMAVSAFRFILARDMLSERLAFMREETAFPVTANPILYFVYSLYTHLGIVLWPARLTFYHEPINIPVSMQHYTVVYLIPAVLALLYAFRKAKKVFFGLGIFILFLGPTYSPVPVASLLIAERYLYLPSVGLSVVAAYLYERYSAGKARPYLVSFFAVLLIGCAIRTVLRNEDWRSREVFWRKTVAASDNSLAAHNNMGVVLREEKDLKGAIEEFKKAIGLNPSYAKAYCNLGIAYAESGDSRSAALFFKKAIEVNPRYADAYYHLGRISDRQEAVALYEKAIARDPLNAYAYNDLAAIYIELGRNKEAITLLNEALELDPGYAEAHFNLSVAYFNEGRHILAVAHCDKAQGLGYAVPDKMLDALKPYRGR